MNNKEELLTAEWLRSVLEYNPDTGVFTWLSSHGGVSAGSIAGNVNSTGYAVVGLKGVKYRQHRLAWLYVHGHWPAETIDHIDCNRTNNRLSNLRAVSPGINKQNFRTPTAANTSGFLGVYWSERRQGFMASVGLHKKGKRRGPYRTAERAYAAYVDLKRTHHEGCTL